MHMEYLIHIAYNCHATHESFFPRSGFTGFPTAENSQLPPWQIPLGLMHPFLLLETHRFVFLELRETVGDQMCLVCSWIISVMFVPSARIFRLFPAHSPSAENTRDLMAMDRCWPKNRSRQRRCCWFFLG